MSTPCLRETGNRSTSGMERACCVSETSQIPQGLAKYAAPRAGHIAPLLRGSEAGNCRAFPRERSQFRRSRKIGSHPMEEDLGPGLYKAHQVSPGHLRRETEIREETRHPAVDVRAATCFRHPATFGIGAGHRQAPVVCGVVRHVSHDTQRSLCVERTRASACSCRDAQASPHEQVPQLIHTPLARRTNTKETL